MVEPALVFHSGWSSIWTDQLFSLFDRGLYLSQAGLYIRRFRIGLLRGTRVAFLHVCF